MRRTMIRLRLLECMLLCISMLQVNVLVCGGGRVPTTVHGRELGEV